MVMKILTSILLASATFGGAAMAGNFDTPPLPVTVIETPAPSNWGGLYLGGVYSLNSGTGDYFAPASASLGNTLSGPLYGGFAGYNFQRGSLVFGGEIAYQVGAIAFDWPLGVNTAEITNLLDAKARAGFSAGKVLVYGVAGFTSGQYEETSGGPPTDSVSFTGFSYGAGVEMKVGENMIVGLEYLNRELSGPYDNDPTGSVDLHLDSIQFRVGWQF